MRIYSEMPLSDFQFWSGGLERAKNLSEEEFDDIECMLTELNPDGMEDVEVNDLFWFDFDTIAQHLGCADEEDFDLKHDPNYVDDDELEEFAEKWLYDYVEEYRHYPGVLCDLMSCFDIADEYDEEGNDPEWTNDDLIADYIIQRFKNGDVDIMSCLFDEDSFGHVCNDTIPTTNELRRMAMNKKAKENEK